MSTNVVRGNIRALWILGVTLSPAQVAANTTAEQTFTVPGVELLDVCIDVTKPSAQAGIGIVNFRVSAANTVAITFCNTTGGGITPTASEVYKLTMCRPESASLPSVFRP